MLLTILGLVLVLAAAFYVSWPLFTAARTDGAPVSAPSGDAAGSPEHDKELALRAIREADFDHRIGKLSDEDYTTLRQELEGRALSALAALDSAAALHAVTPAAPLETTAALPHKGGEPGGFCPACGVRFSRGARFCPGCGKKLAAPPPRGRRRA